MQTKMVEGDSKYPNNQDVGWKLRVWLLLK